MAESQPTTSLAPSDAGEAQPVLDQPAQTASKTSKKKKKTKAESKENENPAGEDTSGAAKPNPQITSAMAERLLDMNPALAGEVGKVDRSQAKDILRHMNVNELMTGMSLGGKNKTDMASYKFWQTQPVPRFDETPTGQGEDGPIKEVDPEKIPKEPDPLLEGFEWCTLDLTKPEELTELYELLTNHYVEDANAMFRFNYSQTFFSWALKSPGWLPDWHVGVRATKSKKLVASICGVPTRLRVRNNSIKVSEINFLCIHKKLRSKRLAPVLIKEVTRRCHLHGIYQAIYTAGIVIPRPVASCRYMHRALDWMKLFEVGFSPLPAGSTPERMVRRNALPAEPQIPGTRPMESKDIDAVLELLRRYLNRFEMAQEFTREEVDHWLLNRVDSTEDRVMYSYVVEDPNSKKVTDFFSFYALNSSVITDSKYKNLKVAYLYYYATEMAFAEKEKGLKDRLQGLIQDALIEAKKAKFDVMNALTLHDNPLFLEHLKFGPGDGQLHYYLYNWRTAPINGGVNDRNQPDEKKRGGVGMVML